MDAISRVLLSASSCVVLVDTGSHYVAQADISLLLRHCSQNPADKWSVYLLLWFEGIEWENTATHYLAYTKWWKHCEFYYYVKNVDFKILQKPVPRTNLMCRELRGALAGERKWGRSQRSSQELSPRPSPQGEKGGRSEELSFLSLSISSPLPPSTLWYWIFLY